MRRENEILDISIAGIELLETFPRTTAPLLLSYYAFLGCVDSLASPTVAVEMALDGHVPRIPTILTANLCR